MIKQNLKFSYFCFVPRKLTIDLKYPTYDRNMNKKYLSILKAKSTTQPSIGRESVSNAFPNVFVSQKVYVSE